MSVPTSLSWWLWRCSEQMPTRMPGLWSEFSFACFMVRIRNIPGNSWAFIFLSSTELGGLWAALTSPLLHFILPMWLEVLIFFSIPFKHKCIYLYYIHYIVISSIPSLSAYNSPNVFFTHDTQTLERHSPLADFSQWQTPFYLHLCVLLFLFHTPVYSLILFVSFMLLFFYVQQPLTMRSYFYLETHPWTSEQKDPQSFNRFPKWLIFSGIHYYMNFSFHPPHCSLTAFLL